MNNQDLRAFGDNCAHLSRLLTVGETDRTYQAKRLITLQLECSSLTPRDILAACLLHAAEQLVRAASNQGDPSILDALPIGYKVNEVHHP